MSRDLIATHANGFYDGKVLRGVSDFFDGHQPDLAFNLVTGLTESSRAPRDCSASSRSYCLCRLSQYCGDCSKALPKSRASSAVTGLEPLTTCEIRIGDTPIALANSACDSPISVRPSTRK